MNWNTDRALQMVKDSQRHRCPPHGCTPELHRQWELAFERQDMAEFERLTKMIMRIRLPKRLNERDLGQ